MSKSNTVAGNNRLSPTDEARLLEAADAHSPMLGWIVRIALETGMRSSEIVTLKCSQVDLQRRAVHLDTRWVPLSKTATEAFDTALANPARPADCDLVFFGEKGKPYAFSNIFSKIKTLGLTADLRHEALCRLVERGLNVIEVAGVTGHADLCSLRRYTHLHHADVLKTLGGRC